MTNKTDYKPRLKKLYEENIVTSMIKDMGVKSKMAVPKLSKIVINMGVNEAKEDIKQLDTAKEDLSLITGQSPQIKRAKKSISNFKLRQGMPIALKVTLRNNKMYEFMDRFISLAAPKIRDFSGFDPDKFDGHGSYNIGLKDHFIFPEINTEKSLKSRGLSVTIVTTAKKDEVAKKLLDCFGFPFKESKK
ncbi:MAG: 50S ribosomal protein L5 [Elusimicrobiales bacterium]|jgi:large subunit ribosomal protein L5|nr:50S ribosomal protein L5 [Elusimicrobiales bacterium]NLH38817.1 50S ribosomal protein L5 [Elusimicrobiota bacterium]